MTDVVDSAETRARFAWPACLLLASTGCYRSHSEVAPIGGDGGADAVTSSSEAAMIQPCEGVNCTSRCDAHSSVMYANAREGRANVLLRVQLDARTVERVGVTAREYSDIAFHPSGRLIGMDATSLIWIDPQTMTEELIGVPTLNGYALRLANAMVAAVDGSLYFNAFYAAGREMIVRLDLRVGLEAQYVATTGYVGGGDLAFSAGLLFLATRYGSLIQVETSGGPAREVGALPPGTFSIGNRSDGVGFAAARSQIFELDWLNARTEPLFSVGAQYELLGIAMEHEGCASR